jgi:hypothetical protein
MQLQALEQGLPVAHRLGLMQHCTHAHEAEDGQDRTKGKGVLHGFAHGNKDGDELHQTI